MRRLLALPVRLVGVLVAFAGLALLAAVLIRFSGALSLMAPLGDFATRIETVTPSIPAIHTLTTPMGGVLRADYLLFSVILICGQWIVARIADAIEGR